MISNYNYSLRNALPSNSEKGGILNNHFDSFATHINHSLRYPEGELDYLDVPYQFMKKCKDHLIEYNKPKKSNKTIMLVHPFFLHLTHMNILTDSTKKDAQQYLETLSSFLEINRDSNVNFVALECLHHYSAVTSLLLENGILDRVILTQRNYGHPLNKRELREFKNDQVFFCGGYNKKCLQHSTYDMYQLRSNDYNVNVHGIKNLIIDSPQDRRRSLTPFSIKNLSSRQLISLEETIRMLNLKLPK